MKSTKSRITIGLEEDKLKSINLILAQLTGKVRDDLFDEAVELLTEKYKKAGFVTELENMKGEISE